MAESAALPEPLDGEEYARVAELAVAAWRAGLPFGVSCARLVATVEAMRRLIDELREASGLDDLIRHDHGGTR